MDELVDASKMAVNLLTNINFDLALFLLQFTSSCELTQVWGWETYQMCRLPVPVLQEARGVRCGTNTGPFLESGVTVRYTPFGGTLMGSRSRSSHRANRWL
jgi:hypothetical protein